MSWPGEPLPRARLTLHFSLRLATRLFQAASPLGVARETSTRLLAGAFVGWDVVAGRWGFRRFSRSIRLLVDVADTAVWTAVTPRTGDYTAALLPACAQLVEVGYDRGFARGVAASSGPALTSAAVRVAMDGQVLGYATIAPLIAAAMGALLRMLEESAIRRRRLAERAEVRAAEQEAERQGRTRAVQQLALVHDQLQQPLKLAPTAASREFGARIKAHKVEYFAARSAVPLLVRTALADYMALRRELTPVLDEQVWFTHVAVGADVLLSVAQVRALWEALDAIEVRGPASARSFGVADSGEVVVVVKDRVITLPPEPRSRWRIDLSTGAVLTQGLMSLGALNPGFGGMHPAVPLTSAAVAWTTAGIGEWQVRRYGSRVRPALLLWSSVAALIHAIGGQLWMDRPFESTGAARYAGPSGLMAWSVLTAMTWDELPTWLRRVAVAIGVGGLAASWLVAPAPRQVAGFGAELLWPATWIASSRALRRDLIDRSRRVRAELDASTAECLIAARARGRAEEFAYARELLGYEDMLAADAGNAADARMLREAFARARRGYREAGALGEEVS